MMKRIRKMKIRTRMLLAMLLMTGLILGTITIFTYKNTENTIESQALYSFEENVQKTCAILDSKLEVLKEATEKLNLETRLYDIFLNLDSSDSLELLRASQDIAAILRDYIPWYSDIYSAHLLTSYYRFGSDTENYYPSFMDSEIAKKTYEAGGRCVWFPTYSYTQMYGITNLRDEQIPYGKLFSVARLMNLSDVSSGKVKRLSDYTENPVLVINFKPDYMEEVLVSYGTNDSLKDTQYYVLDAKGAVVYSTDENYPASGSYQADWLDGLEEESDFDGFFIRENGEKYLLSYSRSKITDWLVVMKIPVSSLIGSLQSRYIRYLAVAFAVMMLVSAFIAWFASSVVNKQFYRVIGTIDRIGQGEFSQKIEYEDSDEFAFFYQKLEKMSNDIGNLIHENYEVKLIQKDTEVKALNAQLNPHFIYNTLNIINWTCLEGNLEATSQMLVNLSRMLHYTSHHEGLYELLGNDIAWLKRYLYIMQIRFADKFDVILDIPQELMELKVPKLFLQPFVENVIVHGFKEMQEKGLLEIHAEQEENTVVFYVEDNGCGMTAEKIQDIMNGNPDSIGIANVNQRIRILYGQEYGVEYHSQIGEGTCVMIRIPK
ncbi:ATPase/histidine kinase/DNA gyrase B/HSP90 domain protein [Marvinbryantia formatexigens DSM 14469]|uniref:ATPase/histidine kinase/DNA gyrase B/HSP90 domain protein n=1 Tax=Marvinbryantia formatexigens DSM 14469 TaxID=478749 RepID=C6LB64_9FIRM|nr:sensor histidine kinase [Marvinbryantia formatexigens]EET62195.1 ATPase/histidine kinase/DNA gyrase B/HSP90 domain protein [Marvinbryantia formatexigens DSM 14469]UWO26471.1 sensor histidine kinase [Marvinbryantia formatexigens DSM 14469]